MIEEDEKDAEESKRLLYVAMTRARDRLVIPGPRSDVFSVYSAGDVCVRCSDSVETMPLTLLESQACATPVVAMNVGGVAETFMDGVSGILVPQSDETAFADAVGWMTANPNRRRAMGSAGRSWVTAHRSPDAMVDGYERVLRDAMAHYQARTGR